MNRSLALQQRRPVRVTVTVPQGVYERLVQRSGQEGRSISNLASFLLEQGLSATILLTGSRAVERRVSLPLPCAR